LRLIRGIIIWVVCASCGAAASTFLGNTFLPENLKPENLAAQLAVYKLKKTNPVATQQELSRAFEQAPKGTEGLLLFLSEQLNQSTHQKKQKDATDLYLDSLDDGTSHKPAPPQPPTPVVIATPHSSEPKAFISDGTHIVDPSAEDKLKALMVSEAIKKEILDNYHRTGILPSLVDDKVEERKPATNK
jgi:hypothetical protein